MELSQTICQLDTPLNNPSENILSEIELVGDGSALIDTEVATRKTMNLPEKPHLYQNYPNPFNPSTTFRFSLPRSSEVTLTIYSLLGEEIQTLISEAMPAGEHRVNWNAGDHPSGIYLVRLDAEGFVQTRKMTVMK